MPPDRLLLAIDGGQTSTKALLAKLDGTILASGRGGPSDHFHIAGGVEKNRDAIHGAAGAALAAAGVSADAVGAITLGLTGMPPEGAPRQIVREIVREMFAPEQIVLVADYVTNLTGASAGEPGVVLIAGGGAIGYGVTGDGRTGIAGGYGYLLGDEGSAYKIGIAAIRAATFDDDLRGNRTRLTQIVCDYFGIEAVRALPQVVYRAGFSRDRISLLTPLVAQAAADGDEEARLILADAGRSLALVALGVIRQLFAPGDRVGVYRTGGVFNIGASVIDPLDRALADGWPGAVSLAPRFPPTVGGLILAARSIGLSPDEAWFANISTSLPD